MMHPPSPSGRRWVLAALIVVALLIPREAFAPGNLVIPNTIAAQSGPNVAASLFDDNWTRVASYVNDRQITLDVLANRAAAGVGGRFFFANDANAIGALYVDNGNAWVQVGTATMSGPNIIRNLTGEPNSGTPASQYDLTADFVQLRNPTTGGVITRRATTAITNNTATAGPAANGRDRSGGFSDQVRYIHLYYIWNGTTLATMSSTCTTTNFGGDCSANGGPNLPSGYTHWAYAAAIPWNGAFISTRVRGAWIYYTIASRTLSAGAATAETSVSVASQVAPNALTWSAHLYQNSGTPLHLRILTAREYFTDPFTPPGGRAWQMVFPNVSQTFFYFGNADPGLTVDIVGYNIPNGGE